MSCCGGRKSRTTRKSLSRVRKPKKVNAQHMKALAHMKPSAKIATCRPQFYGINYSINPWMDVAQKADRHKAIDQWNKLDGTLRLLKAKIVNVKPRRNLPDMVFTANAGFFIKDTEIVVLSNFKHDERSGEEEWFERFFTEQGYYVRTIDAPFEGAGDCLYLGDVPVGGFGFRTDRSVYETLCSELVLMELVDPYFYHLDTCFCPLKGMDYLLWPGAFSSSALQSLRSLGGNELAVPEEEARHFACNAVVIEKNVILPSGCEKTEEMLNDAGYRTYPLHMSEFIKSGGACKCLTLALP